MVQQAVINLGYILFSLLGAVIVGGIPYLLFRRGWCNLANGSKSLSDVFFVVVNGIVLTGIAAMLLVIIASMFR